MIWRIPYAISSTACLGHPRGRGLSGNGGRSSGVGTGCSCGCLQSSFRAQRDGASCARWKGGSGIRDGATGEHRADSAERRILRSREYAFRRARDQRCAQRPSPSSRDLFRVYEFGVPCPQRLFLQSDADPPGERLYRGARRLLGMGRLRAARRARHPESQREVDRGPMRITRRSRFTTTG